jgi:Mrp family chromosome partitioning ATPase
MTDSHDSFLPDLSKDPYFDEDRPSIADPGKSKAIARLLNGNVVARAESAEQIAHMKNNFLLAPQDIREDKVISVASINEPASNAFRDLRRSVFDYTGRLNPIVLVTGVHHDVGSSFVAKNLAAAIALDETSTSLFIDCNIQMSQESDDAHLGLTDFLESKDIGESEIIQHTGIPRLRSIGPGRKRELAGEYFSSPRIRSLFSNISTRYPDRSVVIDGPPASTDAAILADLSDVVLLVVAYGRNTEKQIGNAISILGREKIMGFVFNDQPDIPEYEW